MLGLQQSTEVKRPVPKAQLFKRFDWKPSQRESFDGDVSRLDFVNWIAPRTLPAIAVGDDVKEIFVVEVSLKSRDFDIKNINLLAKSIPQHIIYVLRHGEEVRIAVYHSKLFISNWQDVNSATIPFNGLNLDSVWENIVRRIGNIPDVGTSLCGVESTQPIPNPARQSLQQQIKASEDRDKLLRQIAALERQINITKQPRRKRDLFIEIQ